MVVGDVRKKGEIGAFNYAIYSDDGGETWDMGIRGCPVVGNEAKGVELNNGDVMMNILGRPYRYLSASANKGLTFSDAVPIPELVDPSCDGDLILYTSTKDGYDKNRLVFVNDHHPTKRMNLSIKISYDEGKTWPVSKVIHSGDSWDAAAAVTDDGKIAVYYERGSSDACYMDVVVMSLEWITDGADTYTPPNRDKAWEAKPKRR